MRTTATLGLISAFYMVTSFASAPPTYVVQQVTEGIYYHQGKHADADEQNIGAIANVGFIIGTDCVAVIDSGGSYQEGVLLREAIEQKTKTPVCYVINTHAHPDHIFGNAVFDQPGVTFIGHEKLPAAVTSRQDFYARNFADTLGDAYKGVEFISDYQTVSTESPLEIDLGGRTIEITAYPTAHTDHDITVLDKLTNTLWAGDLLFRDRIPALDGSINGWIAVLEQLQEQSFHAVIPGHGPASVYPEEAGWEDILRYLTTIRREIRLLIEDLATIEEAIEHVGQDERGNWKLFEAYHRRNVTAAFVELEWE
jgi:quinoprotein relay system zinc metallohydrolase 2